MAPIYDFAILVMQNLSQEAFADKAGLHHTYIGSIERGEQDISLDNIEKLATTLGISLAELFSSFAEKPSPQA